LVYGPHNGAKRCDALGIRTYIDVGRRGALGMGPHTGVDALL